MISTLLVEAIGTGLTGAGAPSAIVTCAPAGTVTVPPALAVTWSAPSSMGGFHHE